VCFVVVCRLLFNCCRVKPDLLDSIIIMVRLRGTDGVMGRIVQAGVIFVVGYQLGQYQCKPLSPYSFQMEIKEKATAVSNSKASIKSANDKSSADVNVTNTASKNNNNLQSLVVQTPDNDGWKTVHVFTGAPASSLVARDFANSTVPSKSQAKQELIVSNLHHQKRQGFFVDLAANDAFDMSNTFPLEQDWDWHGLCIEANPKYWRSLTHYRSCTTIGAAVGKSNELVTFHFDKWGGVGGGIVGRNYDNSRVDANDIQVYTVPLKDILDRHGAPSVIDYLSLDVEGAEHFIMESFPYDAYTVRVLTVERPKPQFYNIVQQKGYCCVGTISNFGETLWVHQDSISDLDMASVRKTAVQLGTCPHGAPCNTT
jgi:FkbM family methyltransferase